MPVGAAHAAGVAFAALAVAVWWWRARSAPLALPTARRTAVAPRAMASAASASASAAAYWPEAPESTALPAGLERGALLAEMRSRFVQLQAAWDRQDLPLLARLTTPDMLEQFRVDMPCDASTCGSTRTDVVTLGARLLAFEELPGAYLASVEFSGLMREASGQGAQPFRELWLLARPKDPASIWRLARHQALL